MNAPYPEIRISELDSIEYDDHCVLLVHDLSMLKRLHQEYTYMQLDNNDTIVAIFPFYLAAGEIKNILGRKGIKTTHHENQGSLLISNSQLIHVGPDDEVARLTNRLAWAAATLKKRAVSIVAGRGSFTILDRVVERLRQSVQLKGFCVYMEDDFARLSGEQRAILFTNKYKASLLADS
jgi:hypothetical protein